MLLNSDFDRFGEVIARNKLLHVKAGIKEQN